MISSVFILLSICPATASVLVQEDLGDNFVRLAT
jgi:hypothetical protein